MGDHQVGGIAKRSMIRHRAKPKHRTQVANAGSTNPYYGITQLHPNWLFGYDPRSLDFYWTVTKVSIICFQINVANEKSTAFYRTNTIKYHFQHKDTFGGVLQSSLIKIPLKRLTLISFVKTVHNKYCICSRTAMRMQ